MLLVRPEAKHDIFEASEWYEDRQANLGLLFVAAIDVALQRIEAKPDIFPRAHRDVRRALVQRFPYVVYFQVLGSNVVVLAVLHQRRNPSIVSDRLKS